MNIALWIIAGLLAAAFLLAGLMKLTQPKKKLAANMPWVEDFSAGQVKAIGMVEILGALGLILPAALDIAPILTPIAAAGLALTMVGAIANHLRRGENQMILPPIVLGLLAAFVAAMRFGPNAF